MYESQATRCTGIICNRVSLCLFNAPLISSGQGFVIPLHCFFSGDSLSLMLSALRFIAPTNELNNKRETEREAYRCCHHQPVLAANAFGRYHDAVLRYRARAADQHDLIMTQRLIAKPFILHQQCLGWGYEGGKYFVQRNRWPAK